MGLSIGDGTVTEKPGPHLKRKFKLVFIRLYWYAENRGRVDLTVKDTVAVAKTSDS